MTDWFRSWHGAPSDPKWRMIARRASVRPGEVWSVVSFLWDRASQAAERGSIAGYDSELIAEVFGYEVDEVDRIIAALSDKGVIVGAHVAAWEKYQPKREDDSSKRVKEHRQRNVTQQADDVTHGNAPEAEQKAEIETEQMDNPQAQHLGSATEPRCAAPDYDGLLELLLKANGVGNFRDEKAPGLISVGPIIALLKAGLDLHLDVLPAIRAKPNRKASGWKYFSGQIRDFAQQRQSALALTLGPEARASPGRPPSQSEVFRLVGERAEDEQDTTDRGSLRPALSHLPSIGSG